MKVLNKAPAFVLQPSPPTCPRTFGHFPDRTSISPVGSRLRFDANAPSLRSQESASRASVKVQAASAAAEATLVPVTDEIVIPGGKGKATPVKKGEIIKIVNLHGTQVVDFWAFSTEKWGREIMSMHHTRNALTRTTPRAGDTLYTASMLPIMTFLEDSGPGVHDTTAAACSYGLYVLQIGEEAAKEHDSCTNNLYNALDELGYHLTEDPRFDYYTPAPFNLWMNVTAEPDSTGYNWVMPPKEQKAGDYVTFRAEQDVIVALSACPWDLGEMNGAEGKPQDVSFQVFKSQ